jgi:MATE family multidrug resistance protein
MFFSCTGTMVAIGGATALDTLCAQALDSDAALEDGQVLGLLLRQCLLVLLTLFGTLVTPVWVISGRLFEALGQERGFARETGKFMLMMLPAGMLQVLSECLKKFLQVQNGSDAVGYMTFVASVVGILSNIALVWWTSLGVWAGPVAFGLYQGVAVMLLLCWICIDSTIPKKGLIATAGVTTGLAQSLFYAITGVCTIATEWWSFEILAIMAARLQKDSIGAQGVRDTLHSGFCFIR